MKPWNVRMFGQHIRIGKNAHIVTASDRKVSLATWTFEEHQGHISIGDNCLLCPGVRIDSASSVTVGDNSMIAAGAYLTDADWHDVYDRSRPVGRTVPITLGANVWIGDGSTVCKGVTIGDNSIIGASSVVVADVPANCIAAGNPAKVVKELDPDEPLVTRSDLFADLAALSESVDKIDRYVLHHNTLWGWLRNVFLPKRGD